MDKKIKSYFHPEGSSIITRIPENLRQYSAFALIPLNAFFLITCILNYHIDGYDIVLPVTLAIILFSIAAFVAVIFKKNFFAGTCYIYTLLAAVIYFGVLHDQPFFIRRIPGEAFLMIALIYPVVLYIIQRFISNKIIRNFFNKYEDEAKNKVFSDADLMSLNHVDRDCYYLLKAKIDGVIDLVTENIHDNAGNIAEKKHLIINPGITESELQNYCSQNPNLANTIEFIKNGPTKKDTKVSQTKNYVELSDIFNRTYLLAPPKSHSEGKIFVDACKKKPHL